MKAKILLNQPLTQDRYGLHFDRGVAFTDNDYLIDKLSKKGVKVEIIKEEKIEAKENKEDKKEKTLEEMKVDELKAMAIEKGIELKSDLKKADIIELIKQYEEDKKEEIVEEEIIEE